jgi:DNA-binding CsgD family transcriptional regulator
MLEHIQLAAALADTLDELAAAILLLDARATVLHANAAARAMLSDGDLLQAAANGKLCCGALTLALRNVLPAVDGATASPVLSGAAVGLFARNGERFVATVIPLSRGAQRSTFHSAVAAVFVRKAEIDLQMPLEVVADLYKLTPAETRVLSALVKVGGVREVACLLDICETTVKTHLQRLFHKTGAARQADLIKLVAGFMAPRLAHCESKSRHVSAELAPTHRSTLGHSWRSGEDLQRMAAVPADARGGSLAAVDEPAL